MYLPPRRQVGYSQASFLQRSPPPGSYLTLLDLSKYTFPKLKAYFLYKYAMSTSQRFMFLINEQ